MTPSQTWTAYIDGHTSPLEALGDLLEAIHAYTQGNATPTTREGREAVGAMNAARVALAIIATEKAEP